MDLSEKQKRELASGTYKDLKSFMSLAMWDEAAIVAQELIDMINKGWPNPLLQSHTMSVYLLDGIILRAEMEKKILKTRDDNAKSQ